jgi:hypothetical protein
LTFYNTGILIDYVNWVTGVKNINFWYPNIYSWLVYPLHANFKNNEDEIDVLYYNYFIKGSIVYDLNKLYNYSDFRNLWHWLEKIWDQLVVKPINWTNYVHGQNVVFKNWNISWKPWQIHSTSEYADNYCRDEFAAWNNWWISSNQYFWVTNYAKSLDQNPHWHKAHVCASTFLKIKNPYINGARIDNLVISSVDVWLDKHWNITEKTSINTCSSQVNAFQLPIDAEIDLSDIWVTVWWQTSKIETVGTTKLIKNYTVDSWKVCFYNIKVTKLPRNQSWGANSMKYTAVNITDLELVLRSSDGRTNLADSWKIPYLITKDNTTIPKICFNLDYSFKKVGTYGLLLKFWSNDNIRWDTPIMVLKTIPNNNYKIKNLWLNLPYKSYADGYAVFTGKFQVTDSYWNIISWYDLNLLW